MKRKNDKKSLSTVTKAIVAVTILGIVLLLYVVHLNSKYLDVSKYISQTNNDVQLYTKLAIAGESTGDMAEQISEEVSILRLGNEEVLKPEKINKKFVKCTEHMKYVWENIAAIDVASVSSEEVSQQMLELSEEFVAGAQEAKHYSNSKIDRMSNLMSLLLGLAVIFNAYLVYILPIQRQHLEDEKWRNNELRKKAFIDVHTGLPNKNRCEEVLKELDGRESKVSIVMFDLNDLKKVNDTMGHAYGDAMIKGFANIIGSSFRNDDFVGRYGGDEFIAVLRNIEIRDVEAILKRIKDRVQQHNDNNKNIFISYAYGFAHSDQMNGEDTDRLLNRADNNMYANKKEYKRLHRRGLVNRDDDKMSLSSRIFDGLSETSKRKYVFMTDMATGVTRWSKSAVEYFGLEGEYMEDSEEKWGELIHPDDRQMFYKDIKAILAGQKKRHDIDYRVKNKKGEYVSCTCRGVVEKGVGDEHDLFVGNIFNHGISDNIDGVTSLHNIYSFLNFVKDHKDCNTEDYVMLLGIGNFSTVNAIYGYEFGNQVLKAIAEMIGGKIESCGHLFRMEGTKFACYLEHVDKKYVEDLYADVKNTLSAGFVVDDAKLAFPLSGGAVKVFGDCNEYSIHASVNHALQESKYDKNGELIFFDSDTYESMRQNLAVMNELRNCIKANCKGFYLVYQPVVDVDKEHILGVEALLRWSNEEYGEIPPGEFIPWIENDPIFFDLGNWIIETACRCALPFIEKYPDFVVNVNISYSQLARKTFKTAVIDIIQKLNFPGEHLCLELTERCRQLEINYLEKEITDMKKYGIKFALDDFGTGFSSLNLLSEIPVDTLKIDRGFVYDIQNNHVNQAIVKAVTNCASELNVQVCVEGIEDEVLANFVHQYKVHSYQGYYYSKPKRFEELKKEYLD